MISTRFKFAAAFLAVAVALSLLVPLPALGVVNLGHVTVSAPASVVLASGSSTTVTAACSPAYSDQMPNCMNDYCPTGCDFGTTGGGTACQDPGSGQCTCYGWSYSRYYPSCTVSDRKSVV